MSDGLALFLAVLLLAGNAFFVGAEFALISARRTQIEPRAQAGFRPARVTLRAMENVSLMMAGAQLGITMCSLGLGAIGEPAVAHLIEGPMLALGVPDALLHPVAFTIALGIVVTLHMVLGEMVPKNIAIAGPERSALLLGPALYTVVLVLKPAIVLLNWIANVVLRALRVEPKDEIASAFTAEEVAAFVAESRREGLLDDAEHELLAGALTFQDEPVRSVVLVPAELETVPATATVAEVEQACARTGFSRFPVTDDRAGLIGYVHLKDLLSTSPERRGERVHRKWIRPLVTVSGDQSLREVLAVMQTRGAHLARVVDPHDDRLLGVAALEDVLEELVGEVVDAGQGARRDIR
jgi:CBS domain containing-hemolysin-like protein